MVEVVEAVTLKEEIRANKTSVAEDVAKEVVVRITQISNATSVASMAITRRIAIPTNVTTVTK